MSLKTLLGLEAFPVTEEEIMLCFQEACRKGLSEVVFSSGTKKIKLNLK